MSARLPEGVTIYQGARKFVGEVPDGVVPQEYLTVELGVTTEPPAPQTTVTRAPKQG